LAGKVEGNNYCIISNRHKVRLMHLIQDVVSIKLTAVQDGFGGLVVRMLAPGSRVRGFKPGRSRWIFYIYKSSACLPSEGKLNHLSHVQTLRHVKEARISSELRLAS
jgi:hypothetical protein